MRTHKAGILGLFLIGLVTGMGGAALAAPKTMDATVAYVVDGDTAVLTDGTTVHYIGIEAPDYGHQRRPDEAWGKEAFEMNRRLVAGKRVRLEFDSMERNESGELLAYVHVDKFFVNASLVQSGYVKAAVRSPNTRYGSLFDRLQTEAKEAKRGLWRLPAAPAPTFSNDDLAKLNEGEDAVTNDDLEE